MKRKMNSFAELLLLTSFIVALISLGMMSWNGPDPEGKLTAFVFLLPAMGTIALTLYLKFHRN